MIHLTQLPHPHNPQTSPRTHRRSGEVQKRTTTDANETTGLAQRRYNAPRSLWIDDPVADHILCGAVDWYHRNIESFAASYAMNVSRVSGTARIKKQDESNITKLRLF